MIAVRTLVYFILSSLLNAVLGVVLVLLIHPGNPGIRKSIATSHNGRAVNILDSLLDLGRWYYISSPLLPFSSRENRARFRQPAIDHGQLARSLAVSFARSLVISVLLRPRVKGTRAVPEFSYDKSRILCSPWDEQRLTRSTLPR